MTYLLTQIALGRTILHSIWICRAGQCEFHSAGIRREFRKLCRRFA